MKAILISDRPRWCALMMNGDKTVEVRKGTALYKATQKLIDEYGYAEFYVYCTKDGELFYDPITKKWLSFKSRNIKTVRRLSNGVVKFKFRCYKVEEIKKTERHDVELVKKSCLTSTEFYDYLLNKPTFNEIIGCAIHISDLEIFDKPKELSEFRRYGGLEYAMKNADNPLVDDNWHEIVYLTKAPQSWCYVEENK